jgi:chemotaxis protein methyltransferase CheR
MSTITPQRAGDDGLTGALPQFPPIDSREFGVISAYIEQQCGIHVSVERTYLVQTRLTALMAELGCVNFIELHRKALADHTNGLRDRIVDAMTTNETLWFRDGHPFTLLNEVFFPARLQAPLKAGRRIPLRIWSAACATGQEPYSVAMTALDFAARQATFDPATVEIAASDISPSALYQARNGRYTSLAIGRGLPQETRERYFSADGTVWQLDERVKRMVSFRRHNLQDDFNTLGRQDIIFCRNVLIYFSEGFKRELLHRLAQLLRPDGFLIVGASESLINYTDEFALLRHGQGLYYQVKG